MSNDEFFISENDDEILNIAQSIVNNWLADTIHNAPVDVRKALLLINVVRERNGAHTARLACNCRDVIKGRVDVSLLVDLTERDESERGESDTDDALAATCTKH